MKRKIVVISKCEDFPITQCNDRVMCGTIPENCKLVDAVDGMDNVDAVDGGSASAHTREGACTTE